MSALVSTVSLDPPLLRWVFVDAKTFEVRHGGKDDSERYIVGPRLVLWVIHYSLKIMPISSMRDRPWTDTRTTLPWKAERGFLSSGSQNKILGNSISTITTTIVASLDEPAKLRYLSGTSPFQNKPSLHKISTYINYTDVSLPNHRT